MVGKRYWKGDGDMRLRRDRSDDDADRQAVVAYLQANPGKDYQEAEIKNATGVAKSRVRRLMRGVPGIDHAKLDAGAVCWNPPEHQS
jgi:hypothetical protein